MVNNNLNHKNMHRIEQVALLLALIGLLGTVAVGIITLSSFLPIYFQIPINMFLLSLQVYYTCVVIRRSM